MVASGDRNGVVCKGGSCHERPDVSGPAGFSFTPEALEFPRDA